MEGIVWEEDRRYHQHTDAKWPPGSRQHLSTSTTSRSSNDAVESRSPMELASPGPSMPALPAPGSRSDLSILLNKPHDARRESSAAEQRRNSWRMAPERPSLPSLKTVLGDSMTSPPKTPSPQTALSRPSPSQTKLDLMSTEAYPSKKQRTESFDYFRRPYGAESHPNPSIGSSTPLEPPHNHYLAKHDHAIPPFVTRSDRNDDPRRSLPPLPTPGSTSSRNSMQAFPAPHNVTSPDKHSNFEESSAHRRTPDAGALAGLQHGAGSNYALERWERSSFGHDFREKATSERPASQHTTGMSSSAYSSSPSREGEPPDLRPGAESFYPNPAEEGASHSRDNPHVEQSNRSSSQLPEGHSSLPFQITPAPLPVMLSNFYDLRHPKSRKRTNLPKQSTEIMKRWFEENLGNPYPSEEQKAVFSRATGISMTQVSNWFINHRRRCPELRYMRERTRAERERDGQE